jgi:hypothetical protein
MINITAVSCPKHQYPTFARRVVSKAVCAAALVALVAAFAPRPALADSLISNGGFESPGFGGPLFYQFLNNGDTSIAGWTVQNDGIGEAPYLMQGGSGSPYAPYIFDGSYSVLLNAGSGVSTTFAAVAGDVYDFSIYARNFGDSLALSLNADGTSVDLYPTYSYGLQTFTFTAMTTNPNAVLSIFNGATGADYQQLAIDDATLTTSNTPEPSCLIMLGGFAAVAGVGAALRRRRSESVGTP